MNLKEKLEYHYKTFNFEKIEPDPLQFPHLYKDEKDIEAMAFISSVFAYGTVAQIVNTLNKIVRIMNNQPHKFIINVGKKNLKEKLGGLKHRFYNENDIRTFFLALRKVYDRHGSLKKLFLKNYMEEEPNLKSGISAFSKEMLRTVLSVNSLKELSNGLKFMFPLPDKGSACKRMNLFLRWMVRKDELDFGLWNDIPAGKLIIPVDTHIAKIARRLKITSRKIVSWKMAEEITEELKKYDPTDPVKYDFALCHIGMRKLKL
ncbi:MAG: TIGR02757 family protein [Ignavibacteriaceae bacterium]